MTKHGYLAERELPDGRIVAVNELTYGRGRVIIGDEMCVHMGY